MGKASVSTSRAATQSILHLGAKQGKSRGSMSMKVMSLVSYGFSTSMGTLGDLISRNMWHQMGRLLATTTAAHGRMTRGCHGGDTQGISSGVGGKNVRAKAPDPVGQSFHDQGVRARLRMYTVMYNSKFANACKFLTSLSTRETIILLEKKNQCIQ